LAADCQKVSYMSVAIMYLLLIIKLNAFHMHIISGLSQPNIIKTYAPFDDWPCHSIVEGKQPSVNTTPVSFQISGKGRCNQYSYVAIL